MERGHGGTALVALVVGLGLSQLVNAPRVVAQQAGPTEQMFAVTAPGNGQGQNVLFVIDPESKRLMVYEHRMGGKLELVTVRNTQWETEYQSWPAEKHPRATTPPVAAVHEEVEKLRR